MKKILLVLLTCSSLIVSGCSMIEDSDLQIDIRNKFADEQRYGVALSDACNVLISKCCVLSEQCAVEIKLSEECNGYKYFFSDENISAFFYDTQVREKMNTLDYIEKSGRIFLCTTYEPNYDDYVRMSGLYLYVVGYANERTAGYNIYSREISFPLVSFDEMVSDLSFSLSKDKITMTFPETTSGRSIYYRILFDEEADYAKGLTEAAAVLYSDDYNWERLNMATHEVSVERDAHKSIIVITTVCDSIYNYYNVKCFYNKLQ